MVTHPSWNTPPSAQISTVKFYTDEFPMCLCVTEDEHIVVGMPTKITKYPTKATAVLTTCLYGKDSVLNRMKRAPRPYPCSIAECSLTQNVAVAETGGTLGLRSMYVLDRNFKELFRYKGVTLQKLLRTVSQKY